MKKFLTTVLLIAASAAAQNIEHVEIRPMRLTRASFYADGFVGRKMSNGKRFAQTKVTAASRTFPLGSEVIVRSLQTGKEIRVTITDRGPWHTRYGLDLSKAAFRALGLNTRAGWGWVTVHEAD